MTNHKNLRLSGIIPAVITPFDNNGIVDIDSLKVNVKWLINCGVHGIMVNGCTGEAANLSPEERIQVVKTAVKEAQGKIPVIAGTGVPSTRETVKLTIDAKDAGADAAMVVTPFFLIPNEKGLINHYKTVSEKADIPIVVYHIPQHTNVHLLPKDVNNLCEKVPNIVALKDSYGNVGEFAETVRLVGNKISVLTGGDDLLLPAFIVGAHGAIVAIGNIAPKIAVEIFNSVKNGEIENAREKYFKLLPIAKAIGSAINFPAPVKAAINLLGRPAGLVRSPIVPSTEKEIETIKNALTYADLY